jgi:NADPH:quinone reductase
MRDRVCFNGLRRTTADNQVRSPAVSKRELGDGVRDFQVGDRVADMTVLGSNAGYRTLQAVHLTRVPAGVDAAEAATLILSWTTAYQLLHRAARVQSGQRVLVQGAAGAVGQALLVLGKIAGLELWGTGRGERTSLIRERGQVAA